MIKFVPYWKERYIKGLHRFKCYMIKLVGSPIQLTDATITGDPLEVGEPVTLGLATWANNPILTFTLTLNGDDVTGDVLDNEGVLEYTPEEAGTLVLTVTATNACGTETVEVDVDIVETIDPEPEPDPEP